MFAQWVRPWWGGLVLGGCVLLQPLPGAAASMDWFSDDFETGTLLASDAPAGRWNTVTLSGSNTLANGSVGAHRGQYGLTFIDRNSSSGSGFQGFADVDWTPLNSEEFFLRTWLRLRDVNTSGRMVVIQALPAKVELRLLAPGPVWELAVRNGAAETYVSLHGSRVEEERWYLVEFSIQGLGTATGEARLWVDGVDQGTLSEGSPLSRLDWRDAKYRLSWMQVGEPWTDQGTFTGALDFDDVRVGATPMASRLALQRPGDAGGSSGCIPVDVSLRTSATRALAPAPYEAEVALSTTGGEGRFHADGTCKSPVERVRLPAGASEQRVYFRPAGPPGTVTLRASHPDFLSATLEVEGGGAPDGVPDDDVAGPWTMGLGCTSAPGALVALPVLLWPWGRRGRGWRARR